MSAKVAVVGGGWYGCHIASSMLALGFSVTLFEQHDRLLNEASGNNQFRLHLGFHYPRHAGTRIQSRDGFSRFIERYSELSRSIDNNIYAVPNRTSLVDFDTYKLIMTATGIPYTPIERCSIELADIEGMMKVDERIVLIEKSRQHFKNQLGDALRTGTVINQISNHEKFVDINGDRYDYLIDCTWGHLSPLPYNVFYEPTILLYFEAAAGLPALTFVDGPLYSIYPTEEPSIYTLSSVPFTPLGQYATSQEARQARDTVSSSVVKQKLNIMTTQARENLPHFDDIYRFLGPQLSIKTKPFGTSADRSCYVGRNKRIFSVLSGKIDTIFFATEKILSQIESDHDRIPPDVDSRLRESILGRMNSIGGF